MLPVRILRLRSPAGGGGGGPGDAHFDSVVSLVHFEDSNGTTSPIDVKSKTWTGVGNAQVSTTSPLVGSGSGIFDGAGDSFDTADSTDWYFGRDNFTLEISASFTSLPTSGNAMTLAAQWFTTGANHSWFWFLYNNSGTLQLWFSYSTDGNNQINTFVNWTPSTSTKYDLALSRNGDNLRFFADGVQQGATQTISGALHNSTTTPRLGRTSIAAPFDYPLNGKLDEWRATKYVGRYESNYTPSLPHLDAVAGAGAGWNPADKHAEIVVSGIRDVIAGNTTGNWRAIRGVTGRGAINEKRTCEFSWDNYDDNLLCVGLATAAADLTTIFGAGRIALNGWSSATRLVGTSIAATVLPIWTSTKRIMFSYDSALGYVWAGCDNVYSNAALNANTGDPGTGTDPTVTVTPNTVLYPFAIVNGSNARARYFGTPGENIHALSSGFTMWEA